MTRRSQMIWEPKSDNPGPALSSRKMERREHCDRCGFEMLVCALRHARDPETHERIKVCKPCQMLLVAGER